MEADGRADFRGGSTPPGTRHPWIDCGHSSSRALLEHDPATDLGGSCLFESYPVEPRAKSAAVAEVDAQSACLPELAPGEDPPRDIHEAERGGCGRGQDDIHHAAAIPTG